jgi:FHS family Na+ dependent glucose MFS transporter 1
MAALTTRLKYAITACECLGFFTVGLILALLGPTLLDLADNTGSSVAEIARAFTARSVGYFLGSVAGGKLFDSHFSSTCLLLAGALGLATIGTFFAPLTTSLTALCFIVSLQGIAMGVLDTGGNVLLLKLWGAACGPYLQTLHASFGVGAFVSPFVAQAYIANHETSDHGCDAVNSTLVPSVSTTVLSTSVPLSLKPVSHVATAYMIAAALMVPVSLWFLLLHRQAKAGLQLLQDKTDGPSDGHGAQRPVYTPRVGYVILLMACLFFFCYVGMEMAYGGYLFSFAVKNCSLRFTSKQATQLTSVYWGWFALGRLVSIPLSVMVSPLSMTLVDLAGALVASVLLAFDPTNPTQVWLSSGLFGLSLASVFPSGLHLLEQVCCLLALKGSYITFWIATLP